MLSKFYSFGGFSICVSGDAFTPSKFCEPFEIAECRPDHRILLRFSDDIPSPPAFADHGGAAYRWREGERFYIEFCHADDLCTLAVTKGGETLLTMSERYRKRYNDILMQCDSTVLLSDKYTPRCMMDRNRYMVDRSEILIACYDDKSGGTWNTIKYAMSKDREIIRLPLM